MSQLSGYSTFYKCINLCDVELPKKWMRDGFDICAKRGKKVGFSSFKHCPRILEDDLNVKTLKITKQYAFLDGCIFDNDVKTLLFAKNGIPENFPTTVHTISYCAVQGGKEIILPDSITTIALHAFSGNTTLTKIVIPDSVTEINDFAFKNCKNLSEVILPSHLKKLPICCFQNCEKLKTINLPDTLEEIDDYAFENTGLEKIIIPKKCKSFDGTPFEGCKNLTEVIFLGKLKLERKYLARWFPKCEKFQEKTVIIRYP